jgi:hypothetical protein
MNSRFLPALNLIGCLALTGLVVTQWRDELSQDAALADMKSQLAAARHQAEDDARHRAALEHDISVLKESIEATQQAAESANRELEQKEQLITRLQAVESAARAQLAAWEEAVKLRDDRISALETDLTKTRARLDEAVARLKEASAR